MSLKIIESNGFATIQDSGRKGWRRFGVPVSGPMDAFAFHAANRLAGNPDDCAVIEIGLGDVILQAWQDCIIAVTGVGYSLSIYAWEFPLWSSFFVRGGWQICLNKTGSGMWAYLAVSGGVQTPPILNARSTNLRGHFGGLDGRILQAGDVLRTIHHNSYHEFVPSTLSEEALLLYNDHPIIDVIMGPQTKNFTEESIATFMSQEYTVSTTSDRMGYRLEGAALTLRHTKELISEGITFGSIQVPSSGQPIVMMADCPTTGGYSKIGNVISADLPLLAQCVPNKSKIRFQKTTVAKAQKKYREQMSRLDKSIIQLEENDAWLI
jgi:antagonist of KipI